jgi:alpha-N-arabinofuranosidase
MKKTDAILICVLASAVSALAAAPTFTIDASQSAGQVSPVFAGLMTEEINHSYDGGLYAELVQNRAFLDNDKTPVHWSVANDENSAATITLDSANGLNDKLTANLRVQVTKADKHHPAGVANEGYWGIPVQPDTTYRATILANVGKDLSGSVTVALVSNDGKTVFASEKISDIFDGWKKYSVTLKTGKVQPTAKARLVISLDRPGTVWLAFVSLFPPTWNDQPNGFRKDLMQMLVDMHPKFLRFPGGNYVEGDTVETRFEWKNTIGPVEQRHGHPCPWGYRSTDGLGLLEFLQWCEDMNAEPLLAVYAGYSLKGAHVNPGADLEPFVSEALEEIEYVTGDANTTWGARRAQDGHPAPFKLRYVEIGNEDWFDKSKSYDARFAQFHDAIKAKYPQLKTIATIGYDQPETNRVHSRQPDMMDEHYYQSTDEFARKSPGYAKNYDRHGPEVFVGEWAAHEFMPPRPWEEGSKKFAPTPSLKAAIGDAVFMAAMERNADLIKMQCYAPLLVNVNPGARQWRPNLIGYDALSAYGSPSYYAIKMFNENLGDEILSVTPASTPVQGSATRDRRTGEIFVKLVNPQATDETLNLEIGGVKSLAPTAEMTTLSGSPEDTNSINRPRNVVPVTTTLREVRPQFPLTIPANGIVVLRLKSRP